MYTRKFLTKNTMYTDHAQINLRGKDVEYFAYLMSVYTHLNRSALLRKLIRDEYVRLKTTNISTEN